MPSTPQPRSSIARLACGCNGDLASQPSAPATLPCKADIPAVPVTHKPTYVRIADPARNEVHLGKDSQSALRWLACSSRPDTACSSRPSCTACAPPMPWLRGARWASEAGPAPPPLSSGLPAPGTWTTSDAVWPFLTKEPQKYIACFEVLAQLALLQCSLAPPALQAPAFLHARRHGQQP